MKAAVYYENGGPEVLKYEDVPDPQCHPKGVIIQVEAIAIEGGDTLNRWRGPLMTKPHVVGYQAAGVIIEVGAEVAGLKVGQRVATVNNWGSHAALRSVPARNCWPIPDGFDVQKAAAIPVTFGTAHDCLFEFGRLKAGETVLVQAGASGVGVAAIQLAKRGGAGLILATASSDERLEKLKRLGLDHGINYQRDDVAAEVKRLTDNRGADVINLEPPGTGDPYRNLPNLPGYPKTEHNFAWLLEARNKRSLALDLSRPEGQAVLHKLAAEAEGLHEVFIDAGFEWREPGCSLCFYAGGEGFEPGQRVISSTNRNFEGRQGPRVRTHLASPATVAASAVTGVITDPREFVR
jgi:hypothetical protein